MSGRALESESEIERKREQERGVSDGLSPSLSLSLSLSREGAGPAVRASSGRRAKGSKSVLSFVWICTTSRRIPASASTNKEPENGGSMLL